MSARSEFRDENGNPLRPARVYLVVVQDRHVDVDVRVHVSDAHAVNDARSIAHQYARRYGAPVVEGRIEGWLYYATFSGDGDSVHVVETELLP